MTFEVEYGEVVRVDPGDLAQLLKVTADRSGTPWALSTDLVAAVVAGSLVPVPAMLLWRLVKVADPIIRYDLDDAADATYARQDVRAHLRVEGDLFRQAPRTTAAMMAVVDAELAALAAEMKEK